MSKDDRELKDILEFFCEEDINGSIEVDLYSWGSDVSRKALNNLKNKGLLVCKKSELLKKHLEYRATDKFKAMMDILKPLGRTQRLKYIREQYKKELLSND